jgi:hypothetical protein
LKDGIEGEHSRGMVRHVAEVCHHHHNRVN